MRALFSNRFRHRRNALLRSVIEACPREGATLSILDVGGRLAYWRHLGFEFLERHNVHITLANISADQFESLDQAPAFFTNLVADGCDLPLGDKSFDLCHSNSVIEHVGMWRDFERFASETRRVGRSYYVQTPNFWFPIDPHFPLWPLFHWLPGPFRAGLLRAFPLAFAGRATDLAHAYRISDASRLLTPGQIRYLFPEAKLHAERFALLAKSYSAVHLAAEARIPSYLRTGLVDGQKMHREVAQGDRWR